MSIQKTKSGTWLVRWREKDRHLSATFKRKDDAKAFESKKLAKKTELRMFPGLLEDLLFEDFSELWLKRHSLTKKSLKMHQIDISTIDRYFKPLWAGRKLSTIETGEIEQLQSDLIRERAPKTVNNIVGILHKMLSDAVRWKYINSSPCAGVAPLELPPPQSRAWTKQEARRFLDWAQKNDSRIYYVVMFILNTGLRRAELQALTLGDLDFENRIIRVNKSFDYTRRKVQPFTKHRKHRFVPLNDEIVRLVEPIRGWPASTPAVYFPITIEHFSLRYLKRACSKAGVPVLKLHELRHTFASILSEKCGDQYMVQKVLGHADLRTTERYTHLDFHRLRHVTDHLYDRGPREG